MNGFVAGTLVHTDRGLVPIQDIKVGDLVLSMTEDTVGEKTYKRVVKTFKSLTKQKIASPISEIYCSDTQLFWVQNDAHIINKKTWVSSEWLGVNYDYDEVLQLNGEVETVRYFEDKRKGTDPFDIGGVMYLVATDQRGIALVVQWKNKGQALGDMDMTVVDFREGYPLEIRTNDKESFLATYSYWEQNLKYSNFKFLDKDCDKKEIKFYSDLLYKYMVPDWADDAKSEPYTDYIFTIEVEDFKTYFVGESGLWVYYDSFNFPRRCIR